MTALSNLFPDGPRTDRTGVVLTDDHHTVRRLSAMIGAPRENSTVARPLANTHELRRIVEEAAADRGTAPAGSTGSTSPRRARKRVDVLALSATALALVAVVAAATVGAVQMATASPAASSLQSLEDDEAAIQNAYQSLVSARDRIVTDIESRTADSASVRTALVSTSTAPDPASFDQGGTLVLIDQAGLDAALAALTTYSEGLAAITVPELPAEYTRADIDEDSLVEVGGAIDSAQEQLVALDAATAEMRALRAQVDSLRPAAETAVATYATTFAAAAEAAEARYPDADEALRGELTAAAAAVGSANLWEAAGIAALERYRDAYVAVAADQLRVEIEAEQNQGGQQPGFDPQPQPQPSEEPTDPTTPTDPADPVDPVDPGTEPEG